MRMQRFCQPLGPARCFGLPKVGSQLPSRTAKRTTVFASLQIPGQRVLSERLVMKLLAAAAAGVLWCGCPTAHAEIQTVAPQDATKLARSLPKQRVDKGRVWLLFLAGATALFGAAVALERNSSLFPAIAKSNESMAASRAKQKAQAQPEAAIDIEATPNRKDVATIENVATPNREDEAVLQGLADARLKSQAEASSSSPPDSGSAPATLPANGSQKASGGAPRSRKPSKKGGAQGKPVREKAMEQSSSGS